MKNVLILGGTGAMGIPLVNALVERGYCCWVTSRKARTSNLSSLVYIEGNAHNMDFLNEVVQLRSWDAIVDFMSYTCEELEQRIMLLLNNTRQYVFLSSSRVYNTTYEPITEVSPRLLDTSIDEAFISSREYSLEKAREEDLLINSGKHNWTIVRPYITFGANKFQLGVMEKEDWLSRVLKGHAIVFSRDIATRYTTLSFGKDVARSISALVGHESACGQIFNTVLGEPVKWETILKMYLKAIKSITGKDVKYVYTEKSDYMTSKPWQVKYDRLFDRIFDNSKLRCIYNEEYSDLYQSIEDSLREFLLSPSFNYKPSIVMEATLDRASKEFYGPSAFMSVKEYLIYLKYRLFVNCSVK